MWMQGTSGRGKAPATYTDGGATFKDELQVLYACAASPNPVKGSAWVAYGGRAGLIRCQRVGLGTGN